MFDIITFGSATRDNFLKLRKENYKLIKNRTFRNKLALCFPFGSKLEIEDLIISTGGGGTNTAVTFSNQGFKVAYVGKIGRDKRGEAVIEDLKKRKVFTGFIKKDKINPTAYSAILSVPQTERTILIYRAACHQMKKNNIPWQKSKAKWFYLAPLSGESVKIFKPLVNFAKKNNIKLAVNLGNTQIKLGLKKLKPLLSKIDILILNREESFLLTKLERVKEKEIIKKLIKLTKGIVVITKGKDGSVVSDRNYIYKALTPMVTIKEKTGAGDAYGAGFVSGLIKKLPVTGYPLPVTTIEYAIQLATANATSCIQKIGAKEGLLKKKESIYKFGKVKIRKNKL